jgi:O-methyltransferase involved in polyketide biosynthesis
MDVKTDKVHKIHLTKVQETLIITLYAKAIDNRSKNPILNDEKADQLVSMVDYDFGKFKSFGNNNVIVVRAKQYDEWLKEFLKINPNAVVLNLGCGLDTRVTRINPSPKVSWFDVDYPEVIKLRESFYSNRDGYRMIGSSVTDPNWLTNIPKDQTTIIIAEGLLEYLTPEEVKTLLNRMTDHFLRGQIAFDVMSSFAIKSGQSKLKDMTGAMHKWAVDDLSEVDKLDTKLKRITEVSPFSSLYIQKLPWGFRLLYGLISLIPPFKNMLRLLRYQF